MKSCLSLLLVLALATGQALGQDTAAPAQTSVDALLARLATIELQATVDRDFDGAEHELDAALAAVSASLSDDPRVAAAAGRIRRAVSEAQSQDRAAVEEAVWQAAAIGDTAALSAIGGVAVDLLLDGARAGKNRQVATAENTFRSVGADSMLWMALMLDAGRTAAMIRDERRDLEARGLDVVHLLEQALFPTRWTFAPGGSPQPLDPALLDAVTAELEDTQSADDIRRLYNDGEHSVLGVLAKYGALTDRMCAALARIVRDSPSNPAVRIMQPLAAESVGGGYWPATARPVFEALLADPRADIRRAAAAMLARGPRSDALLACADDSDSQVRMAVARSLRTHSLSYLVWTSRQVDQPQLVPAFQPAASDAESRQALLRLAADSDPAVREAAAQAVLERPEQVPAVTLEKLAADPDAGVRVAMTWLKHPDEALETRLLVGLARDTQPLVLGALDERLASWDIDREEDVGSFLAVFRERQLHPTVPFGTANMGGAQRAHGLFEVVADKVAGRRALTRWSLDTGELEPLRYAVRAILHGDDGFAIDDLDVWKSLEPADYSRLLPMLHELAPLVASRLLEELDSTLRRVEIADALQPLVRDESVPAPLRLQMAAFVTRSRPTEARIADVEWLLLSEPVRRWQPEKTWQNSYLTAAALAVPQPARNALLAHVLAAGTLTDGQLGPLLEAYSAADEGGSALTQEILQRWLASTPPGTTAVVIQAVAALGSMDSPESLQWLITAVHNRFTEKTAIEALVRRPEPEALGVLGECIGSPWISDDDEREEASYAAIGALTGLLSEAAVEELLKGASRAPNSLARDLCLQGVQKIRAYLDSLADWQRRKSTSATRDEAVARLVKLLTDPDANVRAESVRGLGTLRAVEHLPDVIEALRDPSNLVREAARAALDVLNAAVAAPSAGDGGH